MKSNMMMTVVLKKSPKVEKKWRVTFGDGSPVDFGQKGYSDFTIHRDPERMKRYLVRHSGMGDTWTKKNGFRTAGFWSRWLLWSRPSLSQAKKFMQKKFHFVFKEDAGRH